MIKTILLIIVTVFLPPVGVFLVAGCGVDLLINILLTCLGYFPGHIHAFYVEYMYYKKRDEARSGMYTSPAPGIYSQKVQRGGYAHAPSPGASVGGAGGSYSAPVQAGNVGGSTGVASPVAPVGGYQQQGYGTVR